MAAEFQLGDAVLNITGNTKGVNKALGEAEKSARGTFDKIAGMGRNFGIGMAAAGAAIMGGIGAAVGSFTELSGTINDTAAKTGLTTNTLSELSFAAKLTGGEITSLDSGMKGLAKILSQAGDEAAKGGSKLGAQLAKGLETARDKSRDLSEKLTVARTKLAEMQAGGKASASQLLAQSTAVKGLERDLAASNAKIHEYTVAQQQGGAATGRATETLAKLGLSVRDFQGLTPDQSFMKMASAVANIQDPMERAAIAQQVFGRGGRDLLPILAEGATGLQGMMQKARELGYSFDADLIKKGDELGDTFDMLKMSLVASFMQIGGALSPTIQQLADGLLAIEQKVVAWIQANPELTAGILKWAAGLGAVMAVAGPLLIMLPGLATAVGAVHAAYTWLTRSTVASATAKVADTAATAANTAAETTNAAATTAATLAQQAQARALGLSTVATISSTAATEAGVAAQAGLLGRLGALIGGAGVGGFLGWAAAIGATAVGGWALGRWIDNITANTAFGAWIDGICDKLVNLIGKLKEWIGLGDQLPQQGDRTNQLIAEGKIPAARAAGGPAGGLTLVGERGPELVSLPRGSYVHNNGDTQAILKAAAQMGGGGQIVQNITVNGSDLTPAKVREIFRLGAQEFARQRA